MDRLRGSIPFALLAAVVAGSVAAHWAAPIYSPDSWGYYELAESLRSGSYTLDVQRSYGPYSITSPSTAFPPLWPLGWRLAVAVTGLGARSGLVLTGLVAVLLGICSEVIGRRLTGRRWAGFAAACGVLITPGYLVDIVSAGTIPPQLLLVAVALVVAVRRDRLATGGAAILGALSGLLVLLRFDMLPFALMLGAGLTWRSRSGRVAVAFGAACLAALSPWIVMSRLHYGVWFASDNTGIALSTDPSHYLTDWHPPGQAPPTAFDRPAAFVWKVARHGAELALIAARDPLSYGGPIGAVALGLAAVAALRRRHVRFSWRDARRSLVTLSWPRGVLAVFTLAALAMVPVYIVTGYYDRRYFSLLFWLLCLWIVDGVAAIWPARFERLALLSGGALLAATIILYVPEGLRRSDPGFPQLSGGNALRACLRDSAVARPGSRVLFVSDLAAARMSAVHGIPTAFTPRNFWRIPRTARWTRLFQRLNRIELVSGPPAHIARLFPGRPFAAVTGCGVPLFRFTDDRLLLPPSGSAP